MTLPKRPISVFVLGDSISIDYGAYLQEYLGDGFLYARKTGEEPPWRAISTYGGNPANGGNSREVLSYLEVMRTQLHPDILLINAGLHDIRRYLPTKEIKVPLEEYATNLQAIIKLAQTMAKNAMWVTTTSFDEKRHNELVPYDFRRFEKDDEAYHQKALEIMRDAGTSVIDLRTFVSNLCPNTNSDFIHFNDETRRKQAAFIAEWLKDHIASKDK